MFRGGPATKGKPKPVKGPTVRATPTKPISQPGNAKLGAKAKGPKITPIRKPIKPGGSPGTAATTTTHSAPPVQPFLNPTQEGALQTIESNTSNKISALERAIGDATVNTNQGLFNNQHTRDISTQAANWNMAARGLFQSSIRDGDLNDIDATLAMRNNILNTNLNRLTVDNQGQITHANDLLGITHNQYNGLAVANAQAVTPNTNTTTTTTGGTPGTSTSSSGAGGGWNNSTKTQGLDTPVKPSTWNASNPKNFDPVVPNKPGTGVTSGHG